MMVRTSSNPTYSNLAVAAAAAANTGLVIDSPVESISDLSIAVPVETEPGGSIKVADGKTLTFGPFTAPPIRIFDRQTGWLGTVVFGARAAVFVTPSWWQDGTPDDTGAVQIALGYPRVRFTRSYSVKSVTAGQVGTVQTKYQIIDMAGFFLDGILGAPTGPNGEKVDAVLTLHNWANGRMFNAGIRSDGDLRAPQYATNYGCALRFSSSAGGDPTQFGYIHGLRIQNMPVGIVWGTYPTATNPAQNLSALPKLPDPADPNPPDLIATNPPQERAAQSEFHIYDFSPRGVLLPFFGNAENAFLQFHNPIFAAQKFEASTKPEETGGWWDYKAGATLVNLVGQLRLVGGSTQRADSGDGYNLVGQSITVENCDVERSCPDYLIGDVTYRSIGGGYYGRDASAPFRVAPNATGRLLLDDFRIRRNTGVANYDRSGLVEAMGARDYEVAFRNALVRQWFVGAVNTVSYLVRGGQAVFDDLTVDNSGSTVASYRLREGANRLTIADPTGRMMSINDDLTPKGGWISIGVSQGGFHRITLADLPTLPPTDPNFDPVPTDVTTAIRLRAAQTGVEIETDAAFPVESGRDRIVDFWLKYTGAGGLLRANLRWLDAAGAQISRPVLLEQDRARLVNGGFGKWLRFRTVGAAPDGAVAAKLSFYLGANADLMITDLRVV